MSFLDSYEKFRREFEQILSDDDNLTEGNECFFDLVENLDNPKSILEFARSLKTEGNAFFKVGNFDEAMEKYGYAGLSLIRYNFHKEEDKVESFDLAICLLLNLTACLSKTNDCVHIEPNNREIWKELEEIKCVLCKDKLKDDNKNEALIGLGQGLPSLSRKSGKRHLHDMSRNCDREQQEHVQDNYQEVLLDKEEECKSIEEKCTQEHILKEEEECTKPMEDASDQSPTNKDESSDFDLLSEVCDVDRMKQGSLLTITKNDYLSMTKEKTIIYGNAKMGAYMQIRVVNQQPHGKSPTYTGSYVEERVEQIYSQADFREEDKDNSNLMEMSSDVSSCMTREENLPALAETSYPLSDDGSSSSNTTMTPYIHFSANKAPKSTMMKRRHARMKRDDAKYANPLKSRMKNKTAKKMHEENSYLFSDAAILLPAQSLAYS
ncbi:Protein TANC1 [Bienertia sinuspersici]